MPTENRPTEKKHNFSAPFFARQGHKRKTNIEQRAASSKRKREEYTWKHRAERKLSLHKNHGEKTPRNLCFLTRPPPALSPLAAHPPAPPGAPPAAHSLTLPAVRPSLRASLSRLPSAWRLPGPFFVVFGPNKFWGGLSTRGPYAVYTLRAQTQVTTKPQTRTVRERSLHKDLAVVGNLRDMNAYR